MRERLDRVQRELEKRGVVDVKLFMVPTTKPLSEVCDEAADVLEAILAGNTHPLEPFNDSRKLRVLG